MKLTKKNKNKRSSWNFLWSEKNYAVRETSLHERWCPCSTFRAIGRRLSVSKTNHSRADPESNHLLHTQTGAYHWPIHMQAAVHVILRTVHWFNMGPTERGNLLTTWRRGARETNGSG